jgi:hypothetical protein
MSIQLGHIAVNGTARFSFITTGTDGAPIAPSSAFENSDLRIYKNGSATQRSSAAGVTMTSPFDSLVGGHHVDIDLSDNTDAGFYSTGATYEVWLVPDETVDSLAVMAVLAYFTIGPPADSAGVTTLLTLITGVVPTAIENADAYLDRANAIETGLTPRNALRLGVAADAGKLSGAATTTVVIRNAVADSKDRITATVDGDGNRTAITVDLT